MEAGVAGVAVLAMGSNGSRIFEKCHLPLDIQDYFHYDKSSSKLFKLQDIVISWLNVQVKITLSLLPL